ncbi:MAG TPA: hypothetical protein VK509_02960 [Polyangiales bacterium]|nr:hypothetical protein [Polyangiales bacterium]
MREQNPASSSAAVPSHARSRKTWLERLALCCVLAAALAACNGDDDGDDDTGGPSVSGQGGASGASGGTNAGSGGSSGTHAGASGAGSGGASGMGAGNAGSGGTGTGGSCEDRCEETEIIPGQVACKQPRDCLVETSECLVRNEFPHVRVCNLGR